MAKYKVKGGTKVIGLIALAIIAFFVIQNFTGKDKSSNNNSSTKKGFSIPGFGKSKAIDVGVVTWVGYKGGEYFNNGFSTNDASRYKSEYGIDVNFIVNDDPTSSVDAFIDGTYNLLWCTVDALPSMLGRDGALAKTNPVILFQADWSRGGDVIVGRRGISTINDLKGKKIAFAPMSPSHTFLYKSLKAAGLDMMKDVVLVEVPSAIEAATAFKENQVDAAVVWSPDDADCLDAVKGSSRLYSTKIAKYIIADAFIVKKGWVEENFEDAVALVQGWLIGAAEITNNISGARENAIKILTEGLSLDRSFFEATIDNARAVTYGDNLNFFGLNRQYAGVTGEDLYNEMSEVFKVQGYVKDPLTWREIYYPNVIKAVNLQATGINAAEATKTYKKATAEVVKKKAITSKNLKVSFQTGSATLDENGKYIIDSQFLDEVRSFDARIRVIGNTDDVGSYDFNKKLSYRRANAVKNYLVNEYGVDPNRFIIVGNGPDKARAEGVKGDSPKHRVTTFELVTD